VGAASRVSGAAGGVLGAGIHCVGAGQQLFGAEALGLRGALIGDEGRGIEVGLLVVEQRLMFVAGALRVIEHVLRRGAPRLRESCLGLAGLLLGVTTGVVPAGVDIAVQLGLLLVEVSLVAIYNRLLAISEGLFEPGDALIGVKVLLCSVWHAFTPPVGSEGAAAWRGRGARTGIPARSRRRARG
jgi:hypothetical protein